MSTKKPALFMETTEVPAEKTVSEVTSRLVRAGATSIHTEYNGGKIAGLAWSMKIGPATLNFKMPARTEPVYKLLASRRREWSSSYGDKYFPTDVKTRVWEQAERVAWRQLLRWVQAQLAMIDTEMVKPHEVFMPYMMQQDGLTMFEYFESKQLALPAPESGKGSAL